MDFLSNTAETMDVRPPLAVEDHILIGVPDGVDQDFVSITIDMEVPRRLVSMTVRESLRMIL